MKANFYLLMLFLCLAFRSSANRIITGTVYADDDKKPVPGVSVNVEGTKAVVLTDFRGRYSISIPEGETYLLFSFLGYEQQRIKAGKSENIDVWLKPDTSRLNEVVVVGYGTQYKKDLSGAVSAVKTERFNASTEIRIRGVNAYQVTGLPDLNSESYTSISENNFIDPKSSPLSTFAIDVDAASYSNVRRFINMGQLPPKDAVRIEEMINYFKYDLKEPDNDAPVAIKTELSYAPWNSKHQLLRLGLKAKNVETENLPPSNLVFLIDVSGSMMGVNRLPLVKASLKMLVDQLRETDHVAIVTYAGGTELKLPSTSGKQKTKIKDAIDALMAGGATAGGAGLKMAYRVARENFIKNGNNRIILATDGDFNVGASSDKDMEQLITEERESNINISVLGFGMGNAKDSKMETIADKGRGNYAYIDNITEARKAMISEFGGTLFTVAKDVKVQIEFNPAKVQAYRLLGYENRLLQKEDFNNDKKIGGDMGVGHVVTALYEIIPVGIKSDFAPAVDPLKYQNEEHNAVQKHSGEIATIKFRYKDPHSEKSRLKEVTLYNEVLDLNKTSDDFRFASAVAELGMLLRNSDYKQASDYSKLIARARSAKGIDDEGYRAEFIQLAESARTLSKSQELSLETDK